MKDIRNWFRSGSPWVWLNAGAVTVSIAMVGALLVLIAVRGLGHFWAKSVFEAEYVEPDGSVIRLIGEVHDEEFVPALRLRESGIQVDEGVDSVQRRLLGLSHK